MNNYNNNGEEERRREEKTDDVDGRMAHAPTHPSRVCPITQI